MATKFIFEFVSEKELSYEDTLEPVHNILAGNQDYIDNNVVYGIDKTPTITVFLGNLAAKEDTHERLKKVLDSIIKTIS